MRMMRWLVVGVACASVAAGAETERKDVGGSWTAEPMVVTARGYETAAALTPGGVSVVDRETALREPAVGVADLLGRTPGIARVADGAWGSEVNIRGLSRDAVVLLVDGVRVNTATDLGARFGYADPMGIERVEALKGPISSLYGSGALGGVVQIVTRQGRFSDTPAWRGGGALRVGDNPAGADAYLFVQRDAPGWHVFASQSRRDRDSYKDGGGRTVENSQFEDRESRLRAAWRAGEALTLDVNLQDFEGRNIGVPGSGSAPMPPVSTITYPRTSRQLAKLSGELAWDGDFWDAFRLDGYWQRIERRVRIDGLPPASPVESLHPEADHDTLGGQWLARGGRGDHAVTVGVDVWQRTLSSTRLRVLRNGARVEERPLPDSLYRSAGLFAEDVWSLAPAWTAILGARWDHIRVENDPTPQWERRRVNEESWNAHAGAVWSVSEQTRFKLIGASGYRAASLEERYQYLELGGGRVKLGDPDLEPERSLFLEAGADWRGDTLALGLSVFGNRLSNLIGERFADEDTIVNANVDKAEIWGAEARAVWRLAAPWTLNASLAYVEGRDETLREPLAGIPPLNGTLELEYDAHRRYWGRIGAVGAARQNRTPPGVNTADGWTSVHAGIGRRWKPGANAGDLSLTVNNLFDTAYRDYLSTYRGAEYREPGRAVTAQIRFEL